MPPAAPIPLAFGSGARPHPRLGAFFVIGLAAWIALLVGGVVWTARWNQRPGTVGAVPTGWPAASKIVHGTQRDVLVVFPHPRCPCTVATFRELEKIVSRCQERVDTRIVFCLPPGATEGFDEGELHRRAAEIPGATVQIDLDGREARLFDATTSGAVYLFDRDGALRFSGGITASRGHEGENPGSTQVLALVRDGGTGSYRAPVFGCPLFDDAGCCAERACAPESSP